MRKLSGLGVAAILALTLAGCGGGDFRPVFVAEILSDQATDGDIAFDGVDFVITNGPTMLLFGIDEIDPTFPEYRAFLDFPLDGSTGQAAVPVDAEIVSATLEVFIDLADFAFPFPASPIPTRLDLVQYPLSGLTPGDYDSAPFAFRTLDFSSADVGNYVAIDVTPLMREAQRRALADFQARFRLDPAAVAGLVGIEDLPNVALTAPLLVIEYR